MAGGTGRIARALVNGAMVRQGYRAMHRVGLGGWKGDLLRVVGRMADGARGPTPAAPLKGRRTHKMRLSG